MPPPKSPRSTRPTARPRSAASCRTPAPVMPPPMTSRSSLSPSLRHARSRQPGGNTTPPPRPWFVVRGPWPGHQRSVAGGRWPVAGKGRSPVSGVRAPTKRGRWPVAGGRQREKSGFRGPGTDEAWPVARGRWPAKGEVRIPGSGVRAPTRRGRWPVAGGRQRRSPVSGFGHRRSVAGGRWPAKGEFRIPGSVVRRSKMPGLRSHQPRGDISPPPHPWFVGRGSWVEEARRRG